MLRSISKLNIPFNPVTFTPNRSLHASRVVPWSRRDPMIPKDLHKKLRELGEERGFQGWAVACRDLQDVVTPDALIPPLPPFSVTIDSVEHQVGRYGGLVSDKEGSPIIIAKFRGHGFGDTEDEAFRTAAEKAIWMMELEREQNLKLEDDERSCKEK